MFIVEIDIEKCAVCAECVDNCPEQLIAHVEENGKKYAMFTGDPDDCSGCLSCEASCEEGAITVTEY